MVLNLHPVEKWWPILLTKDEVPILENKNRRRLKPDDLVNAVVRGLIHRDEDGQEKHWSIFFTTRIRNGYVISVVEEIRLTKW